MATIIGTTGNDRITGPAELNTIYGGTGNDTITGGTNRDRIDGEDGDDVIDGNTGNDTIYGGNGNDYIFGFSENDLIVGGNGNDTLRGEVGIDTLQGGAGNDFLRGDEPGAIGQRDVLSGDSGFDTLEGGAGDDFYIFSFGADNFDWIRDSAGSGDTLILNNVTLSELRFFSNGPTGLIITRQADLNDGFIDEGVLIENFFGAGRVEFVTANNTTVPIGDLLI